MRAIVFAALILLAPSALLAQNISGSLSGTVQDSAGAVYPNLEVALADGQTGFVRSTKTNAEGFFSYPDLTPSSYTLTVAAPGFRRYVQAGIEITSGQRRALGAIRLALGEVSDSVTVTAEAAPVNLGSSDRGGVITGQEMESLALRGRDFVDAIGLLPGVVDTADSRDAPARNSVANIFIAGAGALTKNITIDGVTNMQTGSGSDSVHNMPSMDSIGEVKVLMSNYAAEHGRNSGGTITIVTRGGGRDFHAAASWYHRHENYSANGFFNNRNGMQRPPYRYNIFGYTASGPVFIPKRFNTDRSRLFFFFSQEFQRQQINYGTRTVTVPTELERNGDFSQTMDVNGRLVAVYDPLVGRVAFPGNRIPASRFHQTGRNILNLFPMPNFVDPAPSRRYQWNYISSISAPYPRHTEIARGDYSPFHNVQINARVSKNLDEEHIPYGSWLSGSLNFPLTPLLHKRPGRGGSVRSTVTLSPTLFNEFTFGVSQNKIYLTPEFPERITRAGTGINLPAWRPDLNPTGIIPNMDFGSVPNWANPSMNAITPYYNANTIFSFVENLSKVHGTHVFKAGLYVERTRLDQHAASNIRGVLSFARDRNNPLDTNYAYASALMGIYTRYSEANAQPQAHYRFTNLEWYVQDAWRVRPRLLLDYGIRFYHDMPQYDKRGQLATFVPSLYDPQQAPVLLRPAYDENRVKIAQDPLTGKAYSESLIGTFVPNVGNPAIGMVLAGKGVPRSLYSLPWLSLAPRLGFSWDPFGRGRTALRGGAGVFYDRIPGNPTMDLLPNPPTVFTPSVYFGTLDRLAETSGAGILAPTAIRSLIGRNHLPVVYNYSFGLQQQIGSRMILDVSYVGSVSRHSLWQRNLNAVPIGSTHLDKNPQNRDPTTNAAYATSFLRPIPAYGDISYGEFAATSNYNSLQTSFQRRMAHGFQAGFSYTFSKALGATATSPFFSPRERNYGPLGHDRTHVASLRYNWILPRAGRRYGSAVLGAFTDGWEISGISRFVSGAPFTPGFSTVDGQDITGTPSEGARIDVANPGAPLLERFGRPARSTFGSAGVNILRGPGINNWDLSLYRTFRIAERHSLQLRLETYNTPNHTQFSSLSTTARFDQQGKQIDPLFLEPTAARSPRRVQLAMRLNW